MPVDDDGAGDGETSNADSAFGKEVEEAMVVEWEFDGTGRRAKP